MTDAELAAFREAENRRRSAPAARAITGEPDPGADIAWHEVVLDDRAVPVRVLRPTGEAGGGVLPLIVHVHGGGFVGTAVQCDWITSRLAVRLPAVVVSVEHRLLAPDVPLAAAAADGYDVLREVLAHAGEWGVDPARTALVGESCGALISALAAQWARDAGVRLRAQVLVNPAVDVTGAMFDHPSFTEFAQTPTLTVGQLRLFRRLAVPAGSDARAVSPLHAGELGGLAPALVAVPTHDPLADQGRAYAAALAAAGTPTLLTEYPAAPHAFLSLPTAFPQAKAAAHDIQSFLTKALL